MERLNRFCSPDARKVGINPESQSEPRPSKTARKTASPEKNGARRVLIVEDDQSLAEFLRMELEAQGFTVDVIYDGEEACAALQTKQHHELQQYELLILDLNLPRMDGISLIRELRPQYPRLPMLVLTGRSRVEDKVHALQTGADDCLTKPFSLAELFARVQALLRRNSGVVPNYSRVGDLTLLREERRVERNGRRIELTPREFAILDVMMRNVGRPVSRATLLAEVWNMPSEPSTNIVDVYMKYVRDKIDGPGEPRLTHTVRGFGYELRESNA
jgi:DNA-binding response OmpR family regulator